MPQDSPVALVYRAAEYVGPALVRLLARSGHRLVLHRGGDLVAELRDGGFDVVNVDDADVSTCKGNDALVNAALEAFGRVDAACVFTGTFVSGPFLESTVEDWRRMQVDNLDSVFHSLRALLPPMIAARHGQVIVFTSALGARLDQPGASLYSATRAGANALVRAVGLEHAAHGVTVNAIGTHFMDFPRFIEVMGGSDPDRMAKILQEVPAGRLGSMTELAEFAALLLDGRSRFQTGQFFSFSGGWSP